MQGEYGNTDSLNFLGFSQLKGSGKLDRDFDKAYELFQKSLEIDKSDVTANYVIGLMNMIGIAPGRRLNADIAFDHLKKAGEDGRALNALGILFYMAPDRFETDPVKIQGFGSVRRDRKKAISLFEQAEKKGST